MSKTVPRTASSPTTPRIGERRNPEGMIWTRIHQREVVCGLGLSALSGETLSDVLEEAVLAVADVLTVEYAAVLESLPGGRRLLLRAGVGWKGGLVGRATVGTGLESPAGYTLMSSGVVAAEDFETENRFEVPRLLRDHGAVGGLCVKIHAGSGVYGVLEAHTSWRRSFNADEVLFLEEVAEVIGTAAEREEARSLLRERTERAEEAEHRFTLLAGANEILCASTDLSTVLTATARFMVPDLADWCFVDVVERDCLVDRLAASRAEPEQGPSVSRSRYRLRPEAAHGTPRVFRTGGAELLPEVYDDLMESLDCDAALIGCSPRSEPGSFICVPLRVGSRTLGAMGVVSVLPGRRYGEEDLAFVEGLAHCASLAIDNALHHISSAGRPREPLWHPDHEKKPDASIRDEDAPSLTPRQTEVLQRLAAGRSTREIGREFHLSEATVRNHVRALLQAFGAHSQLEVLACARKSGILP